HATASVHDAGARSAVSDPTGAANGKCGCPRAARTDGRGQVCEPAEREYGDQTVSRSGPQRALAPPGARTLGPPVALPHRAGLPVSRWISASGYPTHRGNPSATQRRPFARTDDLADGCSRLDRERPSADASPDRTERESASTVCAGRWVPRIQRTD